MNDEPKPTRFPTFRHVFRAVFSRYTFFGLVILATLFALFHAVENWRGNRAWKKYQAEVAARGETLDFKALIPKPVPDDQNAALTPVFASMFPRPRPDQTNTWPELFGVAAGKVDRPKGGRGERLLWDVVAWNEVLTKLTSGPLVTNRSGQISRTTVQPVTASNRTVRERAEAGAAVLKHLAIYDPRIEEIRASFRKPAMRFPVNYDTEEPYSILLPHLARTKAVIQVLQLRVSGELASGQTNAAFDDVMLMLKLTDSLRDEPFLINQLVRIADFSITAQAIWEGLAEHKWNEAQLAALQQRVEEFDFMGDVIRPLHAERAAGGLVIEHMRKRTNPLDYLAALTGDTVNRPLKFGNILRLLVPDGWFQFEKVNHARMLDAVTPKELHIVRPEEVEARADALEADLESGGKLAALLKHRLIARLLLPAIGKVQRRFAQGQIVANQVVAACALERYRLKHGEFPASLAALTPEFLQKAPPDVFTGEPLNYQRHGDGSFTLYSVGWNAKDDSGTPGKVLFDEENGDWVWRYPSP